MRLIDADDLKICYTGTNGHGDMASYASIRKMIDDRETVCTIAPESIDYDLIELKKEYELSIKARNIPKDEWGYTLFDELDAFKKELHEYQDKVKNIINELKKQKAIMQYIELNNISSVDWWRYCEIPK